MTNRFSGFSAKILVFSVVFGVSGIPSLSITFGAEISLNTALNSDLSQEVLNAVSLSDKPSSADSNSEKPVPNDQNKDDANPVSKNGEGENFPQGDKPGLNPGHTVQPNLSLKKIKPEVDLSSGALVYRYPFFVPEGRAGLTPNLSLIYNSENKADRSLFGFGWDVSIPYVGRDSKRGTDLLYDNNFEEFASSISGPLTKLDANRFAAKTEDGSNVVYVFSSDRKQIFAQFKNGLKFSFGLTANSRMDDGSGNLIYRWYLEKEEDKNGNSIEYKYFKDQGQIYPDEINYTLNQSTPAIFKIKFLREARPRSSGADLANEIQISYESGFPVTTRYLIKEIQIFANAVLGRKYQLFQDHNYGTNGRLRLWKIEETGSSDASATRALKFGYRDVSKFNDDPDLPSFQTVKTNLPSDLNLHEGAMALDLNGDGMADILQSFYVENNYTPAGYSSPAPSGTWINRTFLNKGNGVFEKLANSWGVKPIAIGRDQSVFPVSVFIDLNGDNLNDWIYSPTGTVGNHGGRALFTNTSQGFKHEKDLDSSFPSFDLGPTERLQVADFNADGLPDILVLSPNALTWYKNTGVNFNFEKKPVISAPWPNQFGLRVLDLNNDRLPDVVRSFKDSNGQYSKYLYLNDGKGGFAPFPWRFLRSPYQDNNIFEERLIVSGRTRYYFPDFSLSDFNGDGLSDFSEGSGALYINMGDGWMAPWSPIPSGDRAYDADFDANSMTDMVTSRCGTAPPVTCENDLQINQGSPIPEKLNLISEWFPGEVSGGRMIVNYKSSLHFKDQNGSLLNPNLYFPHQIVEEIEEANAVTADPKVITRYEYAGGHYFVKDLFNRRFAGFGKVTEFLPDNSKKINYFHQGNGSNAANFEYDDHESKIGRLFRGDLWNGSDKLLTRETVKYEKTPLASIKGDRFFVYTLQTVTEEYDGNLIHKDRAATYVYDNLTGDLKEDISWGEVQAKIVNSILVFDDVAGDKVRSEYSYATDNFVMRLPSEIKRFDEQNKKISESQIYYDNMGLGQVSKGLPTKERQLISESGTPIYAEVERDFTPEGLVKWEKDPNGNRTDYVYDSFKLYPTETINALGHKIQYAYDYGLGQVKETIDPNGNKWTSKFDGLGRILEERIPNPDTGALVLKTSYEYKDVDIYNRYNPSVKRTDYLSPPLTHLSYSYFDGLGRVIQTRNQVEDQSGQSAFSVRDFIYDESGRLKKESLPYFSPGERFVNIPNPKQFLYVSYVYDSLGRVIELKNVLGSTKTIFDDWKTTVIDPLQKKKEFIKDAYGRLIQVNEFNGASVHGTKYEYDSAGNLKKITDAEDNVRGFKYDLLGRRIEAQDLHALSDASFGVYAYEYDNAGNLIKKTLPEGDVVSYVYDFLNRPKSEDFAGSPGIEITYVYDACLQGKGRLCKETTANSENIYEYNPQGAVWRETKTIEGKQYVTSHGYYDDGSPRRVVNPDLSQVTYAYNKAGAVEIISGKEAAEPAERILIKNADYSEHGQLKKVEAANGTKTEWSYNDSQLLRLQKIKATRPALNSTKTEKFYAHPADGVITTGPITESWVNQRQSPTGSEVNKEGGASYPGIEPFSIGADLYWHIYRSFFSFDTSAIPDGAVIQSARLKLTTEYALDEQNDGKGYISLFEGRQASAEDLVAEDILLCGDLNNPDPLSQTSLIIKNTQSGQPVQFDFLSSKLGFISKTGATKLCLREGHDIDGSEPAQKLSSWFQYFTSEAQGEIQPTLEVTYSWNRPEALLEIGYTYDASGNVKEQKISFDDGFVTKQYSYDDLYRLTQEKFIWSNGQESPYSFDYSAIGNILKTSEFGDYKYEGNSIQNSYANPHAATYFPAFGGMDLVYDKRGNLTSFGGWINSFDWRNQMLKTSEPGLGEVSYGYDAGGKRVLKSQLDPSSNKTAIHYPTDSFNIQFNPDGSEKISKHITLAGFPIVTIENIKDPGGAKTSKTFFNHPDHLNSFTVGSDENANDAEHLLYAAFGRSSPGPNSRHQEQRQFTGHEFDQETGYLYAKARYYDPYLGRFISQDPAFLLVGDPSFGQRYNRSLESFLSDPQILNSYSYARNNPLKYTDPDGEIIPLVALGIAYLALQIALSAADGYSTYQTLTDERAGIIEKSLSLGLFVLGLIDPVGGGYSTGGKIISSVTKGAGKQAIKQADEAVDTGVKLLNPPINLSGQKGQKGLQHIQESHIPGGSKTSGSSVFNQGEDIQSLIKQSTQQPMQLQSKTQKFERIFDVGRNIGMDITTGGQTTIMTVITNKFGDLITAFPGKPRFH